MSKSRTRRDESFPITLTTPELRPDKLSKKQMTALLNQLPFSRVVPELRGLRLYASTKAELDLRVQDAIRSAEKRGVGAPMSKGARDFENARKAANKRKNAQKNKGTPAAKPRCDVEIGTQFGDWTTLSQSYFDGEHVGGQRRAALINVRCGCSYEGPRLLSDLKAGKSNRCRDCAAEKRRIERAAVGAMA